MDPEVQCKMCKSIILVWWQTDLYLYNYITWYYVDWPMHVYHCKLDVHLILYWIQYFWFLDRTEKNNDVQCTAWLLLLLPSYGPCIEPKLSVYIGTMYKDFDVNRGYIYVCEFVLRHIHTACNWYQQNTMDSDKGKRVGWVGGVRGGGGGWVGGVRGDLSIIRHT